MRKRLRPKVIPGKERDNKRSFLIKGPPLNPQEGSGEGKPSIGLKSLSPFFKFFDLKSPEEKNSEKAQSPLPLFFKTP
jgi:hypothetical protein